MKKIFINTDGGARGNPGPAGIGFIITEEGGEVLAEDSKFLGETTNNVAEYTALIEALLKTVALFGEDTRVIAVAVRLDSELVVKQLAGHYKVKHAGLKPLFARVRELTSRHFPNISFSHVRRIENARADKLANEAMDRGA